MSLTQKIQLVIAMTFLSAAAYLAVDIQNTKAKNLQVTGTVKEWFCGHAAAASSCVRFWI